MSREAGTSSYSIVLHITQLEVICRKELQLRAGLDNIADTVVVDTRYTRCSGERGNARSSHLMLKRALAGEHHGHLGIGLVAGLDGLKVAHRAAGLEDGGDPLLDPHIGAIAEGEEGV